MQNLKRLNEEKLDTIIGGTNNVITGSIVNAFVNIIELLTSAGEGIGSSIRRIIGNNMCPLR